MCFFYINVLINLHHSLISQRPRTSTLEALTPAPDVRSSILASDIRSEIRIPPPNVKIKDNDCLEGNSWSKAHESLLIIPNRHRNNSKFSAISKNDFTDFYKTKTLSRSDPGSSNRRIECSRTIQTKDKIKVIRTFTRSNSTISYKIIKEKSLDQHDFKVDADNHPDYESYN